MKITWGQTWPSLAQFQQIADQQETHQRRVVPIMRPLLADGHTPISIYQALAQDRPGTFILESAAADGQWARWSFIGVNAQAVLSSENGEASWQGNIPVSVPSSGPVLEVLHQTLQALHTEPFDFPHLPPLTGGLVGVLGWDMIQYWEPSLVPQSPNELEFPELALVLTADLVAFDHHTSTAWLIANAINQDDSQARQEEVWHECVQRLDAMQENLRRPQPVMLATHRQAPDLNVTYRTPEGTYQQQVEVVRQAITEGDVFQTVIAQRFDVQCDVPPLDVYRSLRTLNPSPYMYLVNLEDSRGRAFSIVGSSPETLVRIDDQTVSTFPIAGSRPRGSTPGEDSELATELLADPKERSEHIMLVDLSRNDLTKISTPGTVDVVEFMAVKRYSHIMHISSTVTGELDPQKDALDALVATFPAGTLSGAPKARAIELIDQLEPAQRGIYGGTVGYFDFSGGMDMAIAIRTAVIRDQVAYVAAGAGIVADSDPETENQETVNKAAALIAAINQAHQLQHLKNSDQ